ncbi:MFS transporter, partial [Streptomyces sp. HSW2009]|uniref:MFS transporter n=1 Tax=Streptomyces sp. HSW2009 TaxID=3142890 RepID=UPI0032EE4C28
MTDDDLARDGRPPVRRGGPRPAAGRPPAAGTSTAVDVQDAPAAAGTAPAAGAADADAVDAAGAVGAPAAGGSAAPGRPWQRHLLVAGLVLAALNLRPAITSLGALLEEVRDGLGMSGTVAGALTSMPALCFAAFGLTAPRLARRWGQETVVCAGLVAIGLGVLVRPFAGGTVGFLLASALALAGIAVSNILLPVIVKRRFPDRVGPMTGLYTMALAVGTSVAAASTVPVTDALGGSWRAGLVVWGALAVAALRPRGGVARRPPTPRGGGGGPPGGRGGGARPGGGGHGQGGSEAALS